MKSTLIIFLIFSVATSLPLESDKRQDTNNCSFDFALNNKNIAINNAVCKNDTAFILLSCNNRDFLCSSNSVCVTAGNSIICESATEAAENGQVVGKNKKRNDSYSI
jgi:hypothetical protein